MEWMPEFRLGWLNGWIPLLLLSLTDIILFLIFPKDVVKRLFDRSGWTRRQVLYTLIGKLCALLCLGMLIFTPLITRSAVFIIGAGFTALGLLGVASALITFRKTPHGEPVTNGLYKISRHPQIVMASIVLLGGCIAIGSWSSVLLLLAARTFRHFSVLAEEEVCLKRYGDSYQQYLNKVPRYFVFF